jgi:hypothetical protein
MSIALRRRSGDTAHFCAGARLRLPLIFDGNGGAVGRF